MSDAANALELPRSLVWFPVGVFFVVGVVILHSTRSSRLRADRRSRHCPSRSSSPDLAENSTAVPRNLSTGARSHGTSTGTPTGSSGVRSGLPVRASGWIMPTGGMWRPKMPDDQVVVRVDDIPTYEPAPGTTLRMLAGEDHGLGLCLISASYPPGAWNPSHRHPRSASTIVVCEGRGGFQSFGDNEVEAGPGDVVLVPAMAWHSFGNIGDDWLASWAPTKVPTTTRSSLRLSRRNSRAVQRAPERFLFVRQGACRGVLGVLRWPSTATAGWA